jgi:oxygen-dependent protoporphyrinogen oxidase
VPLDGYGYVVPRDEGGDVLACTWSSQKWESRAPEESVLLRVYAGRFGGRDVTQDSDDDLVALARLELEFLAVTAEPELTRVHRWPRGMPQYVLGHPQRLAEIDDALAAQPGLAVAGAAYRGVGIPDCIQSGERAAESVARSLAGARA